MFIFNLILYSGEYFISEFNKIFNMFILTYFIKWCSIIPRQSWDLKPWTLYFFRYSVQQASAFGSACTGFVIRNYTIIIHNGLWIFVSSSPLMFSIICGCYLHHYFQTRGDFFFFFFFTFKEQSMSFLNLKDSKNFSTHSKYNRNF